MTNIKLIKFKDYINGHLVLRTEVQIKQKKPCCATNLVKKYKCIVADNYKFWQSNERIWQIKL